MAMNRPGPASFIRRPHHGPVGRTLAAAALIGLAACSGGPADGTVQLNVDLGGGASTPLFRSSASPYIVEGHGFGGIWRLVQ